VILISITTLIAAITKPNQRFSGSVAEFHGAILGSNNMPGMAKAKQIKKKINQPVCATINPVNALKKVRGTAAKLVNKANCVAV
jgi:formylmethanofuran:tetrahydromethanopterin formyltransferase